MQAYDRKTEPLIEEAACSSTEVVLVDAVSRGPGRWSQRRTCIAALSGVLLVMLAATEYYCVAVRAERTKKNAVPDVARVSTQLRERSRLERYQWVDRKAGVLRIPVERAAELVLADYAADSGTEQSNAGAQ